MPPNRSADAPLSDSQAWAAARLGLGAPVSSNEAKSQLLRGLDTWNFLPDLPAHHAIRTLLASDPGGTGEVSSDARVSGTYEDFLREQVENFVRDCFRLPPRARAARWHEWRQRALGYPAVLARLDALRAGLDLESDLGDQGPAGAAALGDQLRQLVLLRPAERAAAWHRFLGTIAQDPKASSRAARWLQKNHPALAALDLEAIGDLAHWKYHGRNRNLKKFFRGPRQKLASRPFNFRFVITIVVTLLVARGLAFLASQFRENQTKPADTARTPPFKQLVPRHPQSTPDRSPWKFFTP